MLATASSQHWPDNAMFAGNAKLFNVQFTKASNAGMSMGNVEPCPPNLFESPPIYEIGSRNPCEKLMKKKLMSPSKGQFCVQRDKR